MEQRLQAELEVKTDPEISDEEVDRLWNLYEAAFKRIASHNPCRQYYHERDFKEALRNPEYSLIIAYDSGAPVFFCMLTQNFGVIPWIAPEFFDKHYPESVGLRTYIPIIFINVKNQGMNHFRTMMLAI